MNFWQRSPTTTPNRLPAVNYRARNLTSRTIIVITTVFIKIILSFEADGPSYRETTLVNDTIDEYFERGYACDCIYEYIF